MHSPSLEAGLALSIRTDPIVEVSAASAVQQFPFMRPERVSRAVLEAGVTDIDVDLMRPAYLKGFTVAWTVNAGPTASQGNTVINSADAWADQIGRMAGAASLGLVAKRRTAIIVDALEGMDVTQMPCFDFAGNEAYFKPDARKLMASPGDARPTQPQELQPDQVDVAVLADWVQCETLKPVRRIAHSWAARRSFVREGNPVVG